MKFVVAGEDNKEEVCRIYQEFINTTHSTQPNDIQKNFDVFIKEKNGYLILVYLDDQPVGFAEFRPLPKKLRDSNEKIEITSLFVCPQYQKKGVGKSLIEYVKKFAKKTNRDRVVLYSGLELTEAHKFYEKTGFTKDALFYILEVNSPSFIK
ncbi:GNAT family N-acetyltransferase [Candidatus Dojkabacteria bacterium]|nr:GNAT family N-acetyltransferase [Candidatus Dojkabacteria bacterium]